MEDGVDRRESVGGGVIFSVLTLFMASTPCTAVIYAS